MYIGGGGRVEQGDNKLFETCGERGNQAGLCSHRKIWPFDLESLISRVPWDVYIYWGCSQYPRKLNLLDLSIKCGEGDHIFSESEGSMLL